MGDPKFLNLAAFAAMRRNEPEQAIALLERAVASDPSDARSHANLGMLLVWRNRLPEAITALRRAIALHPEYPLALNSLGQALQAEGFVDEAIDCFRRAVALSPADAGIHSNLLLALNYSDRVSKEQLAEEHRRWAERHAPHVQVAPHVNSRDRDRRLRVGYISSDFRLHSVAFFIEPLLAAHDRSCLEVFCYANVNFPDETTSRIARLADQWWPIAHLSDAQAETQIRQDRIDVLVDLNGHTAGNRLPLMARSPAPVQVSYLGYPGATGLPQIHWRISDTLADPPSSGEQGVLCLGRCAWCYHPPADAPAPAEKSGPVSFGSFNNLAKLGASAIDVYADVLIAVTGSRIVLKSRGLCDPAASKRLLDQFSRRGIAPSRICFLEHRPQLVDHLAAYNEIDIALDSFPYHGTTTTCDALYMGVPVVTLTGDRHASRVGASLLRAVGLGGLVARSPGEFARIASSLAADRQNVAQTRAVLRQRMQASSLCDGRSLAAALESAYRDAWRSWCDGQLTSGG